MLNASVLFHTVVVGSGRTNGLCFEFCLDLDPA